MASSGNNVLSLVNVRHSIHDPVLFAQFGMLGQWMGLRWSCHAMLPVGGPRDMIDFCF